MQAAKKTSMQYFLGKLLLFQTVFIVVYYSFTGSNENSDRFCWLTQFNFLIIYKYCKKWRRLPNHRGFIAVALTTIELLPF